ncbi:MAG: cytochrome c family protein, partial [Paracoccaceae bacterium]
MFDTMTIIKTIGALAGTLLVFLLGNLVAASLYGNEGEGGEGEAENAYVIEVPDAPEAADQAVEVASVDFASLLAAASVGAGEKAFGKCKACHKIEAGVNGVGPS